MKWQNKYKRIVVLFLHSNDVMIMIDDGYLCDGGEVSYYITYTITTRDGNCHLLSLILSVIINVFNVIPKNTLLAMIIFQNYTLGQEWVQCCNKMWRGLNSLGTCIMHMTIMFCTTFMVDCVFFKALYTRYCQKFLWQLLRLKFYYKIQLLAYFLCKTTL